MPTSWRPLLPHPRVRCDVADRNLTRMHDPHVAHAAVVRAAEPDRELRAADDTEPVMLRGAVLPCVLVLLHGHAASCPCVATNCRHAAKLTSQRVTAPRVSAHTATVCGRRCLRACQSP